ncbi:hypothetical protein [Caballeronia sp. Sq4a]|nr:hypothetical protein [Caballeronia sp. Sq4a]
MNRFILSAFEHKAAIFEIAAAPENIQRAIVKIFARFAPDEF